MRTAIIVAWIAAAAAVCSAQTLVVTRTVPNPIANFDISYIDITLHGAGPTLFQLQILPSATGQLTDRYYIDFDISVDGSIVNGPLLNGQSGRFGIPSGGIIMTSNQFFTDYGDSSASLHTASLENTQARDLLLEAGMIPSGRVTMKFTLVNEATGLITEPEIWFDIVAVRYVKLVTPGMDAGQPVERIPETFSTYPQFVWSSDLMPIAYPPGSTKFLVSVFDNESGVEVSDIPDSRPIWSDTIAGGSSVNYAQYPSAGVRALMPGKLYYWQVQAILQGPVSREVSSELYAFRVGRLETSGTLTPSQEMVLRYLAMILGGNYGYVMGQVEGMSVKEQVTVDGTVVPMEALARLAEQYALGKRMVTHVELK